MAKYEADDTKRLMSRVQKLLNLANDAGASEGERDNAMRMAHAILAKHNLDLAACIATGREGQESADAAEPRVDHVATFGAWPWALQVCASIADLFFCSYLTSRGKSEHFGMHYFIGRTSNATTAALVAEFVVKSIRREALSRSRALGQGNAWLRAFCWGAQGVVRERVRQLKKDAAQQSTAPSGAPGTALVLASVYDTEADANRQYVAKRWGGGVVAKRDRSRPVNDYGALQQGRAYGATVSLRPQIK